MSSSQYDVVIVGGGISGAALLFMLSRYTDLGRVALVEKLPEIAALNSHGRNNSQTLHCGDIETNYTLEKALQVQKAAKMLVQYSEHYGGQAPLMHVYPKMVLGVGATECRALRERFEKFSPHYTGMRLLEADELARVEPNVMTGRTDEVVALAVLDEYSAVNFQAASQSFVDNAVQGKAGVEVLLSTRTQKISRQGDGYLVETDKGVLNAKFVVVSAGAHSLLFAQQMGFGMDFSCLPMAGSFYYTPGMLNGKVYTVQQEGLPFAAIHGDPDILVPNKTRFGPTALILPMLERHRFDTIPDFFRTFSFDRAVLKVFADLFKQPNVRNYMFKNFLFEVPGLRRRLFLKEARKVIPSLSLDQLSFARGIGGIRPMLIDKKNTCLLMGEAKINPGGGIIFNMTPSPGATSCLFNAHQDLNTIAEQLGCQVDVAAIEAELLG